MSRRGLSLLEVVFTASLLAVVLMVLMNVIPTAMLSVRKSEHRVLAQTVAQAVVDECRAAPFSRLVSNQSVNTSTAGPLGDMLRRCKQEGTDHVVFEPRLVLSTVPGTTVPRDSLCQVDVTVSWKYRDDTYSVERRLRLSSLPR
jgi:Tfp pilus assembly protein PilV